MKLKKILSVLLATVMSFTVLHVSVYAELNGNNEQQNIDNNISDEITNITNDNEYYTYEVTDGAAIITGVDKSISGNVVIPDTLGGYPVKAIGTLAFGSCNEITAVTVPGSVDSIGDDAFFCCEKLENVTISDGVTSIGLRAFVFCEALVNITIPDSVTYIGSSAFGNTAFYNNDSNWENGGFYIGNRLYRVKPDKSGEFVIKDGTTTICNNALSYCENITSIIIPDSVTSIGAYAFSYCSNLTSVNIGNGVTSIGDMAFYLCSKLTNIELGNSVAVIGNGAFYMCSFTDIDLPDSLTTIGDYAFLYCDFTDISIPDSVTAIGVDIFQYCNTLANITVDDNNGVYKSDDGVLFTKDGTELIKYPIGKTDTSYTIPNGVVTIGNSAFDSCKNLTTVIIPNSVTTVAEYAFTVSGLTNITIPDSVTYIGNGAFERCTGLTSIVIPDSVTEIGKWAFDLCDNLTISCYKETYAEKYAIENNIPFVLLEETVTTYGDASGDGSVNLSDVTILLQAIAKWDVTLNNDAADVNCDGSVNLSDVTLLLQYIAKWDVVLGKQA